MLFELAQTLERTSQLPFERDAHRLHAVALTVRLPTSLLDGLTLVRPQCAAQLALGVRNEVAWFHGVVDNAATAVSARLR